MRNKTCNFPYLDSKKFLGHVTRHTVEEEGHNGKQKQSQDNFDHKPLVLIADKIADCFQWGNEPEECNVWTAVETKE